MLSRRNFIRMKLAQDQPEQESTAVQSAVVVTPELHLLNRITYGPRPQEVERIYEIGYEAFLEEQLNPESIDDAECDAILKTIPILQRER